MPKILDSAVRKIKKTGKTKEQAYAIAVSTLTKAKILNKKGELTALGKKRDAMSSKERHKIPLASMRKKSIVKAKKK